ncbi:MAG: DivIVA domain-containing protein [Solirubrobacteraceae bacterium]
MPDQSSAATEHAILQEITRPLETLPDDPLSIVNADFPTALRGYERIAVDDYVRQTRRLVAELQATRSPEAAVRRALERVGEQISGILQRAHETAEQITAQSRSEAEDRLQQARVEAAEVARAAEQRVRDLDADTDRIWLERQRIVADAEDLAAQLLGLAKTAAERFPADPEADADLGAVAPYDDDEPEDVTRAIDAHTGGDDLGDSEDEDYFEDFPERSAASEVEQTMAFRPLTPADDPGPAEEGAATGEDSTAVGEEQTAEHGAPPASPEDPTAETRPAPGPPRAPGDEDSTAVIPPASQAAHRRHAE